MSRRKTSPGVEILALEARRNAGRERRAWVVACDSRDSSAPRLVLPLARVELHHQILAVEPPPP